MTVDDKSRTCGGKQCVIAPEGCAVPIHIRDGLPRIDMREPAQEEMDTLPHAFFASDSPWDPSVLDNEFEETHCDAILADPQVQERRENRDVRVDNFGFLHRPEDCQVVFHAQDIFIKDNPPVDSP